jgi:poly(3-hydroxybutyrate) depolymerase
MLVLLLQLSACDVPVSTCGSESLDTCRAESIEVDGETRTYVVSLKHRYDCAQGPRPLLLFFHGSGTNGVEARADYAFFEDAIAGRALIVYLDGKAQAALGGRAGWNTGADSRDLLFTDALVPRLAQGHCVDTTRVFAVGHSRGGRFIEALGCYRSSVFRGLAEASAGAPNVGHCPGRAPIWIAHGTDDRQVGYGEGEIMRDNWAQRNGCAAPSADYPLQTCTRLAGCPEQLPVEWCPYSGAMWDGHYPPPFWGTAVWSFFSSL